MTESPLHGVWVSDNSRRFYPL